MERKASEKFICLNCIRLIIRGDRDLVQAESERNLESDFQLEILTTYITFKIRYIKRNYNLFLSDCYNFICVGEIAAKYCAVL